MSLLKNIKSICIIVVLFLFIMECVPVRFIAQKRDFDAIYEGQNLIPISFRKAGWSKMEIFSLAMNFATSISNSLPAYLLRV